MIKEIMEAKKAFIEECNAKITQYFKSQPKSVEFTSIKRIDVFDLVEDERNTESGYYSVVESVILDVITDTGSFAIRASTTLGKHAASARTEFVMPEIPDVCRQVLIDALNNPEGEQLLEFSGFPEGLYHKLGLITDDQLNNDQIEINVYEPVAEGNYIVNHSA